MTTIKFSKNALEQIPIRGVTTGEIEEAITNGERVPAKRGRLAFRKNFPFEGYWKGRYYETKQVMPIVKLEPNKMVVITVYAFYFGGEE